MSAVIIAASASVAASANAVRIAVKAKQDCIQYIDSFNSDISSVAEKQHYASCVAKVYPVESDNHGVQYCAITLLVCMIIGAILIPLRSAIHSEWEWKYFEKESLIFGPLLGLVSGIGILLTVILIIAAFGGVS